MTDLTPFERVAAVLRHEEPDCVPVFPILLMQGAAELGLSLEEYFSRGEYIAEGQLRLLQKYGHDCVLGFPHVVEDITAFGASLIYFEDGPPAAGGMLIQSYEDVEQMEIPDPASSPMLMETLKAIEMLAREVKGGVPILGACIAPFSLPSMLMGTEMWMELMLFAEPGQRDAVMGRMLEVTTAFCTAWANAQLAAGADAIVLADGMASASVITRQQFADMALPVITDTVSRIQGTVIHEGVGDVYPMIDLLAGTGVAGVMLTYRNHLQECKALVGDVITLIGNLNNIEMLRWSPEEMAANAQAALDVAAPGSGFILGAQGPEIPLGVSEETIHAMVQTAHAWRYR